MALAARLLGRLRDRRASRAGRLIDIGVPPDVDPDGALLLWSALHDLLRPRLRRLLGGQPHLCWEIAAGREGTTFRIWIPQSVPPGLVERALTAAWPGATIANTDANSATDHADRVQLATELVLSGSECFPLGGGDGPDPLDGCPVADLGDRARYFYCPKASRAERDAGCQSLERQVIDTFKIGADNERRARVAPVGNFHPTVKPVALMRWLIRLTTQPGAVIVDPFCGSGSTGCAAVLERRCFIGIERDARYAQIAHARVSHWATHEDAGASCEGAA